MKNNKNKNKFKNKNNNKNNKLKNKNNNKNKKLRKLNIKLMNLKELIKLII